MKRLSKNELIAKGFTYEDLLKLVDALIDTTDTPLTCKMDKCTGRCCEIPPTITQMEFEHIWKTKPKVYTDNGKACPFFHKLLCTVHPYRPVECRIYNRIDKVIGVACGDKHVMPDQLLVIRELVYRLVWEMNGSTEERGVRDWCEYYQSKGV